MAKSISVPVSFHVVPTAMANAFAKLGAQPTKEHMRRKVSLSVTYTRGRSIEAARALIRTNSNAMRQSVVA